MSLFNEVDVLRRLPLFSRIDAAQLKLIAFTSERLTFNDGQTLCIEGEPGDSAFVLLSGAADVVVDTPDGAMHVSTLGPGESVGEIAILCDVPRTATVRAVGEVEALRIGKDRFLQLLRELPDLAAALVAELARRLAATTGKLREATASAQDKDPS